MAMNANRDYEKLSYPLPPAPSADQHPVLLVCLTDLTVGEETKIARFLQQSVKDENGQGPTALIQLWRPHNSILMQPSRDEDKHALRRGYRDSKANVYSVATQAHKAGYDLLFIADGYTRHQLRGEIHQAELTLHEFDDPSVCAPLFVVHFGALGHGSGAEESTNFRVFAKRHTIGKAKSMEILLERHGQVPDIRETISRSTGNSYRDLFHRGLEVHDPSRAIFAPNNGSLTGRDELKMNMGEALLRTTPLPAELVRQVVDCLYDDPEEILGFTAPIQRQNLNVFLLFPAAEDEIQAMQDIIQRQVDRYLEELRKTLGKTYEEKKNQHNDSNDENTTSEAHSEGSHGSRDSHENDESHSDCSVLVLDSESFLKQACANFPFEASKGVKVHLVPWNYDRVADRLDVERYQKMIGGRGIQPAIFLLAPIDPENGLSEAASKLETSPFASVHQGTGGSMFVSRTAIEPMVWHLLAPTHQTHGLQGEVEEREIHQLPPPQVEILQDSEQPFYWVSLLLGSSGYLNPNAAIVLIFYPEGIFSDAQIKDIMREIETRGENDNGMAKDYRMIPFTTRGQDTSSPEIGGFWEALCEVYEAGFPTPYFVADQRTAVDGTLLAMEVRFDPDQVNIPREALPRVRDPEFKGLLYARLPGREACHVWHGVNDLAQYFVRFIPMSEFCFFEKPDIR
ncbi:uncharacterized protein BDV14DRAFT_2234 [Aspergillus stella-maris]|uniref:uncharacterized protein n=1 Tax=Aspergillus stella-maris TaxID=1810926 RepID=UPI003CCE473B